MTLLFGLIVGLFASAAVAVPTPVGELDARATISVPDVVGFPQTVPSGSTGSLYLAYKPYLYVANGCVPYPAVDAQGNTSGGLKPSGASGGKGSQCDSSTGQVYSRAATYGNYFAIMYSWYMPKDQNVSGHRHDWEGVIVWLSSSTSTTAANIVAICPSAHGAWDCSTSFTLSGTSPLIEYKASGVENHSNQLTTTVGVMQPLIAWESLPVLAQTALENTDFGSAIVPFIDAHFTTNLGKCSW